jgi:hypothetical protein
MKKATILVMILTVLIFSFMSYERRWTVEEWKDHLFIPSPRMDQTMSNMITGFDNIEELPPGTHILFKGKADGYSQEDTAVFDMTIDVTVQNGLIQGKDVTIIEITLEMEHPSVSLGIKNTEWVDRTGTPLRMEGEIRTALVEGTESLTRYTLELIGEEQYKGLECWVYAGTERTDVTGMDVNIETEIMQYIDKESKAVVRVITNNGQVDQSVDTPSMSKLEWELGGKETITTDMGRYDCQVIYLKKDDEIVGTMWVNKAFRTPLKYIILYETEDTKLEIDMTLAKYMRGNNIFLL